MVTEHRLQLFGHTACCLPRTDHRRVNVAAIQRPPVNWI